VPAEAEHVGAFDAVVGCTAGHPVVAAHTARRRPALRLSELVERRSLARSEFCGDLLHAGGVEYEIAIGMRTGRGEAVVAGLGRSEREFSERDRDVLDIVRVRLEEAVRVTQARGRLARVLAAEPPTDTAVVLLERSGEIELSSVDAERWLAEHFGPADHPGLAAGARPSGSRYRHARRSSASATPGASPSGCCRATRTRCCSRSRSRASAPTRSIASD
jgi:hypothetical protein